jgi:probable F420-dependent oxidoreductase
MQIGAVLPQTEMEPEPWAYRLWAKSVVDLGFDHVMTIDHVLGADATRYPGQDFHYTIDDSIPEPLVLFAFMAGCAPSLHFLTSVLVLPQRQTALVAAQSALLDRLTDGGFRCGIGLGWNRVEFEALGVPYPGRAARMEEQVELLRLLWQERVVRFEGAHHRVLNAGLNPRPAQGAIPIWFGGFVEAARRRAAVMGDGFIPPLPAPREPAKTHVPAMLRQMRRWRADAGISSPFGIQARIDAGWGTPSEWCRAVEQWRDLGASHVAIHTLGSGLVGVHAHIERLAEVRDALSAVVG